MMSLFALGALAVGYTFANPATSQAQTRVHVGVGPVHVDYNNGYYGPSYFGPSYVPSYSRYDYGYYPRSYYGHRHGHHHHHRETIVVPSYYHWTPDRGYHSHGTIVTPHRGHSHTRPY
jgi:hypothetical protein